MDTQRMPVHKDNRPNLNNEHNAILFHRKFLWEPDF